jgi:hypothetical protein
MEWRSHLCSRLGMAAAVSLKYGIRVGPLSVTKAATVWPSNMTMSTSCSLPSINSINTRDDLRVKTRLAEVSRGLVSEVQHT